ncbi:MAG: polynucleotide kinase-phosphatase [Solirubrobacteraceae bacterium]|nr:polynucleotide kinase-phosphatase [Solirubrobacteraceae bacterium]
MKIDLPDPSLVLLIGASGSGKSSFARKHFLPTEVISSDACRGLVADDENDQSATNDAFAVLKFIAERRLAQPRFTVIDATNVQKEARKGLIQLARNHDLMPVAIVLDVPESVCHERNRARPDRDFGPHVVRNQASQLRKSLGGLQREGFKRVFTLSSVQEVEAAQVERRPLWTDRRSEAGPFDIIGDIHGCHAELVDLLARLGYAVADDGITVTPPAGRRAVFVGDFVDRGPATPAVLKLVMAMVAAGTAIAVPGNHDDKLARWLGGRKVRIAHGLQESIDQLERETHEFRRDAQDFLKGLVSHVVLDEGRLVVAHAGLLEEYQGRSSGRVRDFALYGATTGETDDEGLPIRLPWANDYRGAAAVVYGHTPVHAPTWVNNTLNIDTGCVFGGSLSALRWPEREVVSVPARATYVEPARPFLLSEAEASLDEERPAFLLDLQDVAGKRIVTTGLIPTVTIREENAAAAIEVMSRFAMDPRWLVYLPPTMAPTATSQRPDLLEHPDEAFADFRGVGVDAVVCEEKHMGSRAVVVVCRDDTVASERFGVHHGETGAIYTRTGRPFFDDPAMTESVLSRVRGAIGLAGLWEELETGWLVLDCELLPWSAKAGELVRSQYAAVGAAGRAGLAAASSVLAQGAARGLDLGELSGATERRAADLQRYSAAYRRYVWPVDGIDDLRLAPFHVLAAETGVFSDRPHAWHLGLIDRLVDADPEWFQATGRRFVDLADAAAVKEATAWWESMTEAGGEGMVVKPASFVATHEKKGLLQPGIKCRGPEYLRIIYGPEYLDPSQLSRLRKRSLGRKRGLALREFSLGIEALERFVRNEPLYRVHEAVFSVLALESEPVDPRL